MSNVAVVVPAKLMKPSCMVAPPCTNPIVKVAVLASLVIKVFHYSSKYTVLFLSPLTASSQLILCLHLAKVNLSESRPNSLIAMIVKVPELSV